jgi:hypothetical protein
LGGEVPYREWAQVRFRLQMARQGVGQKTTAENVSTQRRAEVNSQSHPHTICLITFSLTLPPQMSTTTFFPL